MKRLVTFKSNIKPTASVLLDGHFTCDLAILDRLIRAGITIEITGEWTINEKGKRVIKHFKR